ncbi:MAG: DUF1931 family protein [bacterium]
MPALIGVDKFEQLFRQAADLDIDKSDLRRLNDFIQQKVYDLLLISQAVARANGRDIIEPWDIPITRGLQESMNEFRFFEANLEIRPILEQLTPMPMLNCDYSEETRGKLPEIVGALTVSLAKTFKVLDPDLKNPRSEHWEQAFSIFNILL